MNPGNASAKQTSSTTASVRPVNGAQPLPYLPPSTNLLNAPISHAPPPLPLHHQSTLAPHPLPPTSSHPLPPTTSHLPPSSSHPRSQSLPTFIPFNRIRHYMRDEAKKCGIAIQFRKESATALKDICDQFMRELMRTTVEICDQRETRRIAVEEFNQEVGGRRSGGDNNRSSAVGGDANGGGWNGRDQEDASQQQKMEVEERHKRRWAGEVEEAHKKYKQSSNEVSSLALPSSSTITTLDPNNTNNNRVKMRLNKFMINSKEPINNLKDAMNNPQEPKSTHRESVLEIVEQTNRDSRKIEPQDIMQALCHLHLEHLLCVPRKDNMTTTPNVDINKFFLG